MSSINSLKSARRNFNVAIVLWESFRNDEEYAIDVAYHLQQSVKKTLKCFLENCGVSSLGIHDITKLIRMSQNNGSTVQITEWVDSHSDTLTRWEVDTRYNYDFCSSLSTVREAVVEIGNFLELNGLTNRLRPELQVQTTKDKLLPVSYTHLRAHET